jgi:Secretion system C-terminal sorting domain
MTKYFYYSFFFLFFKLSVLLAAPTKPTIYYIAADVCGEDRFSQYVLLHSGSEKFDFYHESLTINAICATGSPTRSMYKYQGNEEIVHKLNDKMGGCDPIFKDLMSAFNGVAPENARVMIFTTLQPDIGSLPADVFAPLCGESTIYVVFGNYESIDGRPMFDNRNTAFYDCGTYIQVEITSHSLAQTFRYDPLKLKNADGAYVQIDLINVVSYGYKKGCGSQGLECDDRDRVAPVFEGDLSICQGERTTITAFPEKMLYQWSNGSTKPTINVGPEISTDYYVSISSPDAPECITVGKVRVEVFLFPTIKMEVDPIVACLGDTKELRWGFLQTPGASFTSKWYRPNGSITPTNLISDINANKTGVYKLKLTYGNGCTQTSTVDLEYETPAPIKICTNAPVCNNEELWLKATTGLSDASWSNMIYNWTGPYGFTATGQALTLTQFPNASAPYTVSISGDGHCPTTATAFIQITNCEAEASLIATTAASDVALARPTTTKPSAASPTQDRSQTAQYNVMLYPNPTADNFNLTLPTEMGACDIQILDALGRQVKALVGDGQITVPTSDWAAGLYFVRVASVGAAKGISVWLNVVVQRQ